MNLTDLNWLTLLQLLGAAVALSQWTIAVVLSVLNFLLILSLTTIKSQSETQSKPDNTEQS